MAGGEPEVPPTQCGCEHDDGNRHIDNFSKSNLNYKKLEVLNPKALTNRKSLRSYL